MKSIRVYLWASFVVGAVLSVIAQVHSEDETTAIPVVTVLRRPSLDFYHILQGNKTDSEQMRCDAENATYLVKENQCINNHYLFNGSSFVITPVGEKYTQRLLLNIEMTDRPLTIAQTINMNDQPENATITFISREEQVNGSTCQFSSLEVYRGREQAIEISHQGFSLSDSGSIEIYADQLVYSIEDYVGELYRMNLSCSGGRLPESGCLFFKVAGITNISEAKFNCSVPGTLSSQCSSAISDNMTTTIIISDNPEPTTLQPTSDSIETMSDSTTPAVSSNILKIGGPLFYGIVGAGAAVIIMTLFCLICICVMLGCTRECKCGRKIGAANRGQPAPYEEVEIQDMKMQGYNPSFHTDSISPYNKTEQDLENKYAEIEAMYQEISPRVHNPKSPAWERTSSAVTNTGSEPPQHQYSTLEQVGGQAMRNNLANSVTNINSEQYAQLVRD